MMESLETRTLGNGALPRGVVGAYLSETNDVDEELEAAKGIGHPQHHVVQLGLHQVSIFCGEGGIRTLLEG